MTQNMQKTYMQRGLFLGISATARPHDRVAESGPTSTVRDVQRTHQTKCNFCTVVS